MLLSIAAGAAAQDWPQWRGPARDGHAQLSATPEAWPEQLSQKWSVTVGEGAASPALVGGRLYVFARQGEDEVILCLNLADGSEVWADRYPAPAAKGPAGQHPGPRSSPCVAEGKVITLGLTGILSCLDATSGAVVWRKDPFPGVTPEFYTSMSPMVVAGAAIAHLGGKGNGALVAFDLATGEAKWQWTAEGPEYASPVLMQLEGSTQIVTLTEKSLVGVDAADGKLLWQQPFVPESRAYNAATPIVDGQTVIYTGARRGTRAVKIEKQGDGFAATELWANPDVACQFSTPVLVDGMLYGVSDRGNAFCLDAASGEAAWLGEGVLGKGSFCGLVGIGPAILALPNSGELVGIAVDPTGYQEIGRLKVAQTPTYAHPIMCDEGLLVKDATSLTLWQLQ